ncbi:S8 family serine peptidase [Tahibacter amnicola]|uniref:S8 family serine peptidase n=2 Tax=Tahibacter amnicola TaxID=2976241 RepID=A0ABY6BLD9_9GAMM|nr:S8 family serine peptidase [Tahibacter amnicola]
MAGVKRVEFLPRHTLTHQTSVPFLGSPVLWEGTPVNVAGVKGEGIRIGIIDTGLDYQHPDFGGTGLLADYQANDRTIITDQIGGNPIFPTAKVIGGIDLVGDAYTGSNTPAPDPDPMDCNGHGTHVAGSAAGFGVTMANAAYGGPWDTTADFAGMKIGPGVAPRASLYGIRVFGCGGSTNVTVEAIDHATDPNNDDDLSDRLDVINMSLGSNFGLPWDASAEASDNATLSGMIVVTSAGNAADTYFISGSPGSGRKVIATANSVDPGVAGPLFVNAPAGIAGYKIVGSASFGTAPPPSGLTADVVAVDDASTATEPPGGTGTLTDGCQTPFTNAAAVAGKIAFIDRGSCPFKRKAYNAQLNGAVGVIIGNVATSNAPNTPPGMADDATIPAVTIPAVSVALADANAFRTAIAGGTVNATLNQGTDTISASTSRGPGGIAGAHYQKPDLAAPGTSITSAQTGVTCTAAAQGCQTPNATGYIALGAPLVLSGTSMASPHAAGLAALVRQQNPTASTDQIKAILTSSSSHDLSVAPAGAVATYSANRVGVGRIDVPDAGTNIITAVDDLDPSNAAVTFNVDVKGTTTVSRNVRLQNRTAFIQNVTLALDTNTDSPGVAFALTGSTTVAIPAGGSVLVPVQMSADAAQMDRYLDPSMASTQSQGAPASLANLGPLPRHFLSEESANLIVSKTGNEVARVAINMAHRPHSDMAAPDTNPPGSPTAGVVALPLTGQDVCTGTPGATCTGNFGTTDHVSLVSPFELQVTNAQDNNLEGYQNVKYVGVNYDATNSAYLFGIATYGPWGTPTHSSFSICVDNNEDGNFDRVIFNTNLGNLARLFGQNVSGQDVFMNAVLTPPSSVSFAGPTGFVNMQSAAQIDSAVLDNNVLVLGATASQLGLTAGDTNFRYAVAVCPGFASNCVTLATPNQCTGSVASVPGVYTYNSATPGITTSGGAGGLPILLQDLNGSTLNVTYNEANMQANGSTGLLLLHHHNSPSNSAQVVIMDSIFADGFDD